MDGLKNSSDAQKNGAASSSRRAVTAIAVLYVAFFLMWCIGLLLGFTDSQATWFGLPVWFMVSCVLSSVIICLALARVARRYF